MPKFCLGNNSSAIRLKNMLLEHGLTEKHFKTNDYELYLDVECTRLSCKQIPIAGYPDINHSTLAFGTIKIAANHTNNTYHDARSDTILYQENWPDLPSNLNNPEAMKLREKQEALEQYHWTVSKKLKLYLEKFKRAHKASLEAARKVWVLGWFATTYLPRNPSLEIVLEHAAKANNRSRQICRKFGWLRSDGRLDNNAPQIIKNLNNSAITSYDTLTKELNSALLQDGSQRRLFKEVNWLDEVNQLTEKVPPIIKRELVSINKHYL